MASFVSARFEKDELPITDQVRIILRNLDQGNVPPQPSTSYFPTDPDELQPFVVSEFVSRVTGENFVRIADLSDLDTLTVLVLNTLEDMTTDFIAAGVIASDLIEITLVEPEIWTSEEYPGTNPFVFSVSAVLSATQIEVALPFPAFGNALNWDIPARSLNGTAGVTLRSTVPPDSTTFLERRFNRYFIDAVAATNFVTATKADLDALANESVGAGLVSESYTAEPS
jgi:hypothetical protein